MYFVIDLIFYKFRNKLGSRLYDPNRLANCWWKKVRISKFILLNVI